LLHGRYVCTSRRPHCERCGLTDVCPSVRLSSTHGGKNTQP
jgi:endonuclease-3